MQLAEMILGVLGRVAEGVSLAISAARAKNEDEAFAILERVLKETAGDVAGLRPKITANQAEAAKALADKFAAPNPTVLVDPAKVDEETKP
jgi:hypothetical protein